MEAFQYGALVSKRVAGVLRVHGHGGVVAEEVGVVADHAGHDLEGHFQHLVEWMTWRAISCMDA